VTSKGKKGIAFEKNVERVDECSVAETQVNIKAPTFLLMTSMIAIVVKMNRKSNKLCYIYSNLSMYSIGFRAGSTKMMRLLVAPAPQHWMNV
jgi:hypothetical protein